VSAESDSVPPGGMERHLHRRTNAIRGGASGRRRLAGETHVDLPEERHLSRVYRRLQSPESRGLSSESWSGANRTLDYPRVLEARRTTIPRCGKGRKLPANRESSLEVPQYESETLRRRRSVPGFAQRFRPVSYATAPPSAEFRCRRPRSTTDPGRPSVRRRENLGDPARARRVGSFQYWRGTRAGSEVEAERDPQRVPDAERGDQPISEQCQLLAPVVSERVRRPVPCCEGLLLRGFTALRIHVRGERAWE